MLPQSAAKRDTVGEGPWRKVHRGVRITFVALAAVGTLAAGRSAARLQRVAAFEIID
jgi:hypothetical protein